MYPSFYGQNKQGEEKRRAPIQQQAIRLTPQEQQQAEIKMQLFVVIRCIDFIEKAYNQDKIECQNYKTQIERYLNKYSRLSTQIPQFQLQIFMESYQLNECSWAEHRIKEGLPQEQKDQAKLLANITNTFNMAIDLCQYHRTKPQVSIIKPNIEDLLLYLQKAKDILGADFEPTLLLQKYTDETLNSKQFTDVLSEQEHEKLVEMLDYSFKQFWNKINK